MTPTLLLVAVLVAPADDSAVRLAVRPAAAPRPALKYQLLPEVRELVPGNPVQWYLRCFAEQRNFFFSKEGVAQRVKYQKMTLEELAAEKLQLLANRLSQYSEPRLGSLLPFGRRRRSVPEGLYLYGGVGRGKTMLLDLFFDAVHYAPKRRVHFQEFMAEAHEAIDRGRKEATDPIASAAAEIASNAALLCFDEFEVTDIADAMILGRLFQHLFASSVVIVSTSNTAPRDLYRDGLNRQLFLPFSR